MTLVPGKRGPRIVHDDVFRRLCRARDLADERCSDALTIPDLARQAGLSPFHFLRLFRQVFGETPHAYLTRRRIERARLLLERRRDMNVTDVCLDVGFSSLGTFSSLFARRVGLPPGAYQRQFRALAVVPDHLLSRRIPCCFLLRFAATSLSQF